jgi:hypothetical protein
MGIISVLCFISVKHIISQHEGQLLAHLMIDTDIAMGRGKQMTNCLLYQHSG